MRIKNIVATGGKRKLKDKYYELKEDKRNVFITDLDYDYILNKEKIIDENFIYLDRYCIENYYIDEEACVIFLKGRLEERDKETRLKLNFARWYEEITDELLELGYLFLIVQKYILGIENTGSKFELFQDSSILYKTDTKKIEAYKEEVKLKLQEEGIDLKKEIELIKEHCKEDEDIHENNIITGKYYLSSLFHYLKYVCKGKGNIYMCDLKTILCNHFDISTLSFIKSRVEGIYDNTVEAG